MHFERGHDIDASYQLFSFKKVETDRKYENVFNSPHSIAKPACMKKIIAPATINKKSLRSELLASLCSWKKFDTHSKTSVELLLPVDDAWHVPKTVESDMVV